MLVKDILKQKLIAICDKDASTFVAFPGSWQEAGLKWGDALNAYASAVTPVSTTSAAALAAFIAQWNINEPTDPKSFDILIGCINSYAVALAPGMLPAFTGTPPAGVLNFESVYNIGVNGGSAGECIGLLIDTIDTWFKTGVAINTATGATVTWS